MWWRERRERERETSLIIFIISGPIRTQASHHRVAPNQLEDGRGKIQNPVMMSPDVPIPAKTFITQEKSIQIFIFLSNKCPKCHISPLLDIHCVLFTICETSLLQYDIRWPDWPSNI